MKENVIYEITKCGNTANVKIICKYKKEKRCVGFYDNLLSCKKKIYDDFVHTFNKTSDKFIIQCKEYDNLSYVVKNLEKEELNEETKKVSKPKVARRRE